MEIAATSLDISAVRIQRSGYPLWSDERTELLKKYHAEGLSFGAIAHLLDMTRNAVIGRAHRLGLPGRARIASVIIRRKEPKPRARIKTGRKVLRALNGQHGRHNHVFGYVEAGTDLAPSRADNPCNLIDNDGCRWPCEGDGLDTIFCGGERFGEHSYCLRHCRVAYQPPRR